MTSSAVLLMNFGGPASLAEVRPFMENLFSDPVILPFPGPIRRRLARYISRRRSPMVEEQYRQIGGGSTLVQDSQKLAGLLAQRLGSGNPVFVAMAYTPPGIDEVLDSILSKGIDTLVCLALFPHYSLATTGSIFNSLSRAIRSRNARLRTLFIPAWHEHPGFLDALTERIRSKLQSLRGSENPTHLLFSAHGLPISFIRKGDPYQAQIQQNVRTLLARLGWTGPFSLSYQSRVGPVRWLSPSTDNEIERLAATGCKQLLVIPLSFVSEHLESLYEIDLLYGKLARGLGIDIFERTDAIGFHPRFVDCLEDLVNRALQGRYENTCVRCLLPREPSHFRRKSCRDCGFQHPAFQKKS